MLNSHVLAVHARPPRRVRPDVQMKEITVINSNTTVQESRNLQREFKHLLQREAGNRHVGGHPAGMLAVIDPAHLLIVCRTAVAVMNDDGPFSQRPEQFQGVKESGLDLQCATAMAGEFCLREMLAQITQSPITSL